VLLEDTDSTGKVLREGKSTQEFLFLARCDPGPRRERRETQGANPTTVKERARGNASRRKKAKLQLGQSRASSLEA